MSGYVRLVPEAPWERGSGLLTVTEVAEWLHVHVNTIKRLDAADLPYTRIGTRGDRRYRREDVLAYLNGRSVRR